MCRACGGSAGPTSRDLRHFIHFDPADSGLEQLTNMVKPTMLHIVSHSLDSPHY
jgi:hypothetical protein